MAVTANGFEVLTLRDDEQSRSAELLPFLYDGGPLSDPGARLGARRHLILPPGGGNNCFHE